MGTKTGIYPQLKSRDWRVREAAVEAWGASGDQAAVAPVVAALNDRQPQVRWAALTALAKLGRWVSVDPVLQAVESLPQSHYRAETLVALERLGHFVPINFPQFDPLAKIIRVPVTCLERIRLNQMLSGVTNACGDLHVGAVQVLAAVVEEAPADVLAATALEDLDERARRDAARALGCLGERAPIKTLAAALKDRSSDVRSAAAQALGSTGERMPIKELVAALRSRDAWTRQAVAQSLGEQAPADALLAALHDAREDEYGDCGRARAAAATALGRLGERMPVAGMTAELTRVTRFGARHSRRRGRRRGGSDRFGLVRNDLMRALAQLGARAPMESLIEALCADGRRSLASTGGLYHPNREVRMTLRAHMPIELLTPYLHHRDYWVRAYAVSLLGTWGDRAPIEWITAAMADPNDYVRSAALVGLANLGERGVPQLIAALQQGDEMVRKEAVRQLGGLAEYAPVEPLVQALRDPSGDVRHAAAFALRAYGDRAPIEPLLDALRDDDHSVRQIALDTLGLLGERVPIATFVALLRDEEMGLSAAHALGTREPQASVEVLAPAVASPVDTVRSRAVEMLGALGEHAPLDPIIATLHDENDYVRMTAIWALRDLGTPAAIGALAQALQALQDADKGVRLEAVNALAAHVEQAPVAALVDALQDTATEVQVAALNALGTIGERAPADALVAALGNKIYVVRSAAAKALWATHPDALLAVAREAEAVLRGEGAGEVLGSIVQAFVADAIGEIAAEDETIPPLLIERLVTLLDWPHWEVRMKAAQALGKLHGGAPPEAIDKLRRLLHDPGSRAVRSAAEEALGAIGERA